MPAPKFPPLRQPGPEDDVDGRRVRMRAGHRNGGIAPAAAVAAKHTIGQSAQSLADLIDGVSKAENALDERPGSHTDTPGAFEPYL